MHRDLEPARHETRLWAQRTGRFVLSYGEERTGRGCCAQLVLAQPFLHGPSCASGYHFDGQLLRFRACEPRWYPPGRNRRGCLPCMPCAGNTPHSPSVANRALWRSCDPSPCTEELPTGRVSLSPLATHPAPYLPADRMCFRHRPPGDLSRHRPAASPRLAVMPAWLPASTVLAVHSPGNRLLSDVC